MTWDDTGAWTDVVGAHEGWVGRSLSIHRKPKLARRWFRHDVRQLYCILFLSGMRRLLQRCPRALPQCRAKGSSWLGTIPELAGSRASTSTRCAPERCERCGPDLVDLHKNGINATVFDAVRSIFAARKAKFRAQHGKRCCKGLPSTDDRSTSCLDTGFRFGCKAPRCSNKTGGSD